MTTSGTYAFAPSAGEVIMMAFRRIGITRTALMVEHVLDARLELNYIGSAWSNTGPNLWAIDTQVASLVQGVPTITISPTTIDILDAWISTPSLPSSTDRIITSVGRETYASYPSKLQQGLPTTFWFDRLEVPTLTLWPVPDGGGPYVLNFMRTRQMQDATTPSGATADVPYRYLDALCWSLAERLAYIYAPDKVPVVGAKAQRAVADAQAEDTEDAPIQFAPGMSGYFR